MCHVYRLVCHFIFADTESFAQIIAMTVESDSVYVELFVSEYGPTIEDLLCDKFNCSVRAFGYL